MGPGKGDGGVFSPVALASAIMSVILATIRMDHGADLWLNSRRLSSNYSAGKRDRGKKEKKNLAPLARAKEGPKAPTQARSTEEEAEGLRRLGRTQAPPEKKFSTKVENCQRYIYVFTQNSKLGYLENHFPDEVEA